jgi:uncharacterized protein (TIGR02145 family)
MQHTSKIGVMFLLLVLMSCSKNSTGPSENTSSSAEPSSSELQISSSSNDVSSSMDASSSMELSSSIQASSSSFVHVLDTGSFVDGRDGQTYGYTKIGTQTWMAQNLNFQIESTSYCFDDDAAYCDTYGRLYTWETVLAGAQPSAANPSGVQGVCPEGWHVPSEIEWENLLAFVANASGLTLKRFEDWQEIAPVLKSTTSWEPDEDVKSATDDFGFSALASGSRASISLYSKDGIGAYWWTATEYNDINAVYAYTTHITDGFFLHLNNKGAAYPVRCVRD